MGDIAFNINSNVDINKVVDWDIDKNVDADVNNPDQLATAQSDAEAFGTQALAETDTYTYVTENEAFSFSESVSALDLNGDEPPLATPGGIEIGGTTDPFFVDVGSGDPLIIEIQDIDDVDPLLDLDGLYAVPDGLPDLPNNGNPISFDPLDLVSTGEPDPLLGNYELATDSTVNYGEVPALILDVDGDNATTDDRVDVSGQDLLVIFPAGTLFGVENEPEDTNTEVEIVGGGELPYLTFSGITDQIPIESVFETGDTTAAVTGRYFFNWDTLPDGNHFIDPSDV